MKIDLSQFKKALNWIEVNSLDMHVSVFTGENGKLKITCFDKYGAEVDITLFADGTMMPKIRKTDVLR
jgi:hypothetical protein